MKGNKRPTSVTIVGWILIIMSVFSLVGATLSFNSPMTRELMSLSAVPIPVQYVLAYVGLLLTMLSGIMILKGRNWGRWLYVGWTLFGSLFGLLTSPMKTAMIPGIVIFLIFTFILFRPRANAYFGDERVVSASAGTSSGW